MKSTESKKIRKKEKAVYPRWGIYAVVAVLLVALVLFAVKIIGGARKTSAFPSSPSPNESEIREETGKVSGISQKSSRNSRSKADSSNVVERQLNSEVEKRLGSLEKSAGDLADFKNQTAESFKTTETRLNDVESNLKEIGSLNGKAIDSSSRIFLVLVILTILYALRFGLDIYLKLKREKETGDIYESPFFTIQSIMDWQAFAGRLTHRHSKKAVKRVVSQLDTDARKVIDRLEEDGVPDSTGRQSIINGFNRLLDSEGLFDLYEFQEINLPTFAVAYLDRGLNELNTEQVRRFNRALLEAVFPYDIVKSEMMKAYLEDKKIRTNEENLGKVVNELCILRENTREYVKISSKILIGLAGQRAQEPAVKVEKESKQDVKNEHKLADTTMPGYNLIDIYNLKESREDRFYKLTQISRNFFEARASLVGGNSLDVDKSANGNPYLSLQDRGPILISSAIDGKWYLVLNPHGSSQIDRINLGSFFDVDTGISDDYFPIDSLKMLEPGECKLLESIGREKKWELIRKGRVEIR